MASTIHFAVSAVAFALLVASVSSSPPSSPPLVYKVGDEHGWTAPANGTETYNHWAKKNPIKVGDVLSFKYANNDSVLLVDHDDYKQCSSEAPLKRFTGGDTKFTLDHYGPVYFVSGALGHCEAGQRMIVRVQQANSEVHRHAPAPAPGMPPTVGGRAGGAHSPRPAVSSSSSPAAAPVASGSGSASTSTSRTPSASASPSPSPLPQASSGVASSSVAVGLIVILVANVVMALSVVV